MFKLIGKAINVNSCTQTFLIWTYGPSLTCMVHLGILELQGWTDGMDLDSDPDLSLVIAVMTLVIGVMTLFIVIMSLIRGQVLRLMASLIVHATQVVYIADMWSEL